MYKLEVGGNIVAAPNRKRENSLPTYKPHHWHREELPIDAIGYHTHPNGAFVLSNMSNVTMRRAILLWMAVSVPCAGSDNVDRILVVSGATAIESCSRGAETATGKPLSVLADRAYVHVFEDTHKHGWSVSFTHGEIGAFGTRSSDYRAVIFCNAIEEADGRLRIRYMSEPLGKPLIGTTEDYEGEAAYGGRVMELLYLRQGNEFIFVASQEFSEENIDKNNPDIQPPDAAVEDHVIQ